MKVSATSGHQGIGRRSQCGPGLSPSREPRVSAFASCAGELEPWNAVSLIRRPSSNGAVAKSLSRALDTPRGPFTEILRKTSERLLCQLLLGPSCAAFHPVQTIERHCLIGGHSQRRTVLDTFPGPFWYEAFLTEAA